MRVAVDAMGGDNAPAVEVEGVVAAAREFGIPITIVGDSDRLRLATPVAKTYFPTNRRFVGVG